MYTQCVYIADMAAKDRTTKARNDRWTFRVPANADRLVRQAAEVSHQSLTEFVVDASTVAAERVLADRTLFVLDQERWNEFIEMLDRPVREKPGLEKLFATPSVFQ
jgi:uncharacterized protein (DUF1778 family)